MLGATSWSGFVDGLESTTAAAATTALTLTGAFGRGGGSFGGGGGSSGLFGGFFASESEMATTLLFLSFGASTAPVASAT